MEGLDTEWSHPSNQQIITYTNIPNGNFRLKVRMYNNSLSQIVDERTLDIHVIPLYWQTWWFRLVVFIIIMSITFFVLKFYINRLKQRHAEDKIRFFTNTAHDLRTSITLINAPIQELNKEKELYRFKIFGHFGGYRTQLQASDDCHAALRYRPAFRAGHPHYARAQRPHQRSACVRFQIPYSRVCL